MGLPWSIVRRCVASRGNDSKTGILRQKEGQHGSSRNQEPCDWLELMCVTEEIGEGGVRSERRESPFGNEAQGQCGDGTEQTASSGGLPAEQPATQTEKRAGDQETVETLAPQPLERVVSHYRAGHRSDESEPIAGRLPRCRHRRDPASRDGRISP